MFERYARAACAAIALALVTACGGGGGGGGTTPPATPSNAGGGTAAPSATFTLTIPAATGTASDRRAQSVSPGTQSFVVALDSVNGTPQTASVEADVDGPSCTPAATGTTCSVAIAAPAGTDVFTVTLYTATGAHGAVLGTITAPDTIAANGVNRIALTVNGTIASLALFLATTRATAGVPLRIAAYAIAFDASGAEILLPGGYTTPITVTSLDPAQHVLVAVDGAAPAPSAQLASPSDTLAIAYDGAGGAQNAVIQATVPGVAPATATLTVAGAALAVSPAAVVFTQLGAPGAQTVTIAGGVPPYLVNGATEGTSGALTFGVDGATVTLTASGAVSTTLAITDAAGDSAALPVTASTLTVPIQ